MLIDGPVGNFDANPGSVFGCEETDLCAFGVPFSIVTDARFDDRFIAFNAFNDDSTLDTLMLANFLDGTQDSGANPSFVFASFTAQGVSEVPLPAAAWMFLAGLGGLSAARRKKRASA